MKTDDSGGTSAANDPAHKGETGEIEQRLARRFAVELDRAERDYPALRRSRDASNQDRGRSGRSMLGWRRLALPVTAVAVLLAVSLVGVGLTMRPNAAGPAAPSSSEPSVSPMGPPSSDGIPNQIDGQRVYLIADKAEWQNLTGSFLLSGYAVLNVPSCPPPVVGTPEPTAEQDLIGWCSSIQLVASPNYSGHFPISVMAAPRSWGALTGWTNGPAIVMRVHIDDPESANCASAQQAECQAAVVVESVVWPTVPMEIDGNRIFRASDQGLFPTSGSFLLGGPFEEPEFALPCAMRPNLSNAEQQLIPYCYVQSIDGLPIAPMSNIDATRGQIVVARVHVNDPLAAQCPASDRADCRAAIVVESVVWHGDQPAVSATPAELSAKPSGTAGTNPASAEGIGPAGSGGASASARSAPPSPAGAPSALTTDTTTTPPYSPSPS
jgi:hypothetical protein